MAVRAPASKSSPAQPDERLLVEAAQKDPARFAELYELHFEPVYLFIARRVPSREIAEDLTSDVFHKALANLQRFEWRGVPFGAWLLRIAANAITDRGKKSGREVTFENPPDLGTIPDLQPVEDGARLFRLVDELPADQKQVLLMRFTEEKSIREIATELNRSEGAIKQLQFRAITGLRSRLTSGEAKPQRKKLSKNFGGGND